MAFSITSTYAGQQAAPYFSCALLELNSLSNGSITVKQNIVGKTVVNKGLTGATLKGATCDFDNTSNVTITERILDPATLQITDVLCKTDFLNDWQVEKMGNSAWKDQPTDAVAWLTPQLLAAGMAELEDMIWQGVAGADSFDGFITLMTADVDVIDVVGLAAGTLDASNVIDEIEKVVAASPTAIKTKSDYEIIMDFDGYEAYRAALGAFDSITPMGELGELRYNGYRVLRANGMPLGYMVASTTSNLWFGTAVLSDLQFVKVVDTSETLNDNNIRFKAQFVAGVQHGCGSDSVLYTPV